MSNDNNALIKTDSNLTIRNVNGVQSLIAIDPDTQAITIKPLELIKDVQTLKPSKDTLETLEALQGKKTTYSAHDPLVTLLWGACLILGSFLLFMVFMPREKLPFEIQTCKPTWFLFFQTGETCQIQKGYR